MNAKDPLQPMEQAGLHRILDKVTDGFFDTIGLLSARGKKLDRNKKEAQKGQKEAGKLLEHARRFEWYAWCHKWKWKAIMWIVPILCLLVFAAIFYKALTLKDLRDDLRKA